MTVPIQPLCPVTAKFVLAHSIQGTVAMTCLSAVNVSDLLRGGGSGSSPD